MGNLLYVAAVVLIIAWLVGFPGFHAGGLIHLLLVIVLIAIILRIIQGKKMFNKSGCSAALNIIPLQKSQA